MTVKELKERLNNFPDSMDVFIPSTMTDFTYGLVNSAKSNNINFYDEGSDEVEPVDVECVVLTED